VLLAGAATSKENSTSEHVVLHKMLMALARASHQLVGEHDMAAHDTSSTAAAGGYGISTMLLQSLEGQEQNTMLKQGSSMWLPAKGTSKSSHQRKKHGTKQSLPSYHHSMHSYSCCCRASELRPAYQALNLTNLLH
jgi:hypothetical protein